MVSQVDPVPAGVLSPPQCPDVRAVFLFFLWLCLLSIPNDSLLVLNARRSVRGDDGGEVGDGR